MKSDLNLLMVNSVNSTQSLFSSNQSTTDLAALFAVKGWINPAQEILLTESIAQEKQQRLTKAFERYVEQPDAHRGYELIAQLQEAKADLTAEYDYAKKQQVFYQAQAEHEAKSGGGVIADWTQWLWRGMQDFFGSSNAALEEKYSQMAADRQRRQTKVSLWAVALQQELLKDSKAEKIVAQRHLLQQTENRVTVQNPISDQWINVNKPYSYPLNSVFSGVYTILGATETNRLSLPGWLSIQYSLLGSYAGSGHIFGIAVLGNTVYVADEDFGLLILDVSTPSAPQLLGNYSGSANDIAVLGNTVYVADWNAGLLILDVSIPSTPRLLGNYSGSGDANAIALSGNIIYVADWNAGLLILDVSIPSTPRLLGNYSRSSYAHDVAVLGNTVYVADGYAGLLILNVTTPSVPHLLGNYPAGSAGEAWDVAVSGNTVYMADALAGLLILNVSTPSTPRLLGSYPAGSGYTYGVVIAGNTVFIANGWGDLMVLDVSKPSTPRLLGGYSGLGAANRVAVSGNLVFLTSDTVGLSIFDISQGQLAGVPPGLIGQQLSITVTAHSLNTTLAATQFTLILDQLPSLIQTVSDQSLLPGQRLSLPLSSQPLFVNPTNPFLELSLQTVGAQILPTWLDISITPVPLGNYATDLSDIWSVIVSGNTVYMVNETSLLILDVSTPSVPRLIGNYSGVSYINGVAISGNTVYVADEYAGLLILDVSIPSTPRLLGSYPAGAGDASNIAVLGNTVYVADWNAGLLILDVSTPSTPRLLGSYPAGAGDASNIAVLGNTVYVADWNAGLLILDVSTPSTPRLLGSYPSGAGNASSIAVLGNTVYVVDWNAGLLILDVSTPSTPRLLGSYPSGVGDAFNVVVLGNTIFLANKNALIILDVSTPNEPRFLGSYLAGAGNANGVAVSGNTVYVADRNAGLLILDVSQWQLTAQPQLADVGNYNLQLVVTDELGGHTSTSFTIRVEGPPQFNRKIPAHYAKVGETFSYFAPLGLVTDPNLDPITFDSTLVNGQPLPHWLSFSPISATYAGTPEDGDVGDFIILLTATDNIAGITNTTFNLYVNHVPTVVTPLPQALTGRTGGFFAFQIPETTFSDWSDDSILFYNATLQDGSPLPAWLSFNGSTQNRTFLGTPIIGRDEGTLNLIVQATDNLGAYTSAPMQLSLLSNSPPYVTAQIPDQPATIEDLFRFSLSQSQIPFLDINGDPLTYTADCPPWLKLEIENQSTTVAPPYWPQWLAYNSISVNMLTFSGRPLFNDYSDALLFRGSRVVIYAYDDFPNPQSRASMAFNIQVQGINQTGISIVVVSLSLMLGLAIYGAYKKWPALYNCFCKKRYSVNSVTAYIGESFEYKPTAVPSRIQAGEVEEVTVVLPPKTNCYHFFQPYRPLKRGLERPNWMEYDFQSNCLRTKSSLPVAKVDNEDQLIVQLRKENSQIVQQFTLFIHQRLLPLEDDFKNSEEKQNNVELTSLTRFVT